MQHRIEQVLAVGAYTCAPRELALARAHLAFARSELAQGNADKADDHLKQASLNARAAERLSPAERCAVAASVVTSVSAEPEAAVHESTTVVDSDRDGVIDALDRCPNQPEDMDGFQDADGCPDPDNDEDGVPDALDRCPLEPGSAANQGCPRLKYKDVEVEPEAIRILQPIEFGTDTAIIRSVSYPLLDTVVEALKDHPKITLEIQGHTDSRGDDRHNMRLSQARADAVLRYLVDHGIDASRLTAHGYGETRPIESNQTSQGRDINRRMEFVRTDATP